MAKVWFMYMCFAQEITFVFLCSFTLCIRFPSARVLHVKGSLYHSKCLHCLSCFLCGKYSHYRRVIFPALSSHKDIINKLRIRFIQMVQITRIKGLPSNRASHRIAARKAFTKTDISKWVLKIGGMVGYINSLLMKCDCVYVLCF